MKNAQPVGINRSGVQMPPFDSVALTDTLSHSALAESQVWQAVAVESAPGLQDKTGHLMLVRGRHEEATLGRQLAHAAERVAV